MKHFFMTLATAILLFSCSNTHETGRKAAEDVINLVKSNRDNVEAIVKGLDSLEKIYHEDKLERDFEIGFENAIKPIVNAGFKHEVHYNRYDTKLTGNLPIIYSPEDSHVFTIVDGINDPEIAVNVKLYNEEDYGWEPYDEFTGEMDLVLTSGGSRNYEFSYSEVQDIGNLGDQEDIRLAFRYRNLIGVISDTPLDDVIATFNEINNITTVNMRFEGKFNEEEKKNHSSDNTIRSRSEEQMDDDELDDALEEYDDFVMSYIELIKKVNNNDMTALAEYPAMMQKAQSAQEKMNKLQGQMTPAQLGKFMKLQAKYLEAMQDME